MQQNHPRKMVVLTFDDGFRNIVERAYPIMLDYGAKGIFSIVSDLIGTPQILWTDHIETVLRNEKSGYFDFNFRGKTISYPLHTTKSLHTAMWDIKRKLRTLTNEERISHLKQFNDMIQNIPVEFKLADWDQICSLDKNILEIGCHTATHANCTTLVKENHIKYELLYSKRKIENKIGYKVNHFCYPAGSFDDNVVSKIKEFGYKSATTCLCGFNTSNTDAFLLKRVTSHEDILLWKAQVSGSFYCISDILTLVKKRIRFCISVLFDKERNTDNEMVNVSPS